MRPTRIYTAAMLAALASSVLAQKKPLDHSVYDGWKSVSGTSLSRDGRWLAYVINPQEGDGVGTLRAVADGRTITIPRASGIQFSKDGKWALATVLPPFEEARKARRGSVPAADQPKGALAIVDLGSGKVDTIERVNGFTLPREDVGWFLYRPEPPRPATPANATPAGASPATTPPSTPPATAPDGQGRRGGQGRPGGLGAPGAAGATPATRGTTYVLRQLGTGKEERLEFVDATAWDKNGKVLATSLAADKDGKGSAIVVRDLEKGTKTTLVEGIDKAKYPRLVLTEDGTRIAFASDKDDLKAKKPALALFVAKIGDKTFARVPVPNAQDDVLSEGAAFRFTPSGARLIFSTTKKPVPDPELPPADERVSVDIWTYKDPQIMPQQLLGAASARTRGYEAIYDVASGKSVQIETKDLPSVQFGADGDGRYGLADVSLPYQVEATWNPGNSDLYVVDLRTGEKRPLITKYNGNASLSPDGAKVAVYRGLEKTWSVIDLASAKETVLKLPYPVYDELHDTPDLPNAYGLAGWTKAGTVLVQDKYDVWACDPTGAAAPRNLTSGRLGNLRFEPVRLNGDEKYVDPDDMPLTVIQDDSKAGGLYWRRNGAVQKLVDGPYLFGFATKAKDADTLVVTRQSVAEYPDLWLTNVKFERPTKVTDANPQQKGYNWLTAELVTWTSSDGTPLQGILYKPEDFDYGKKYPMISYFYERNSDTLHNYRAPAPSASTINIPLFVSQGYLVFVPDIPYKPGAPGLSALNAIVPGVNSVVARGYVDPKRLGIQGQSWGGYQVAHLVTVTNMFAAAEAGAPVSDMFSAYGGVRYGTGVLRQMQYEHGQSRIGGTPWDSFLKYVENSPVFHVDSVQTPLMIMSNDKDGAVPHTQGIELYSAMRRLGKPCWMVVYNDEDHNLVQRKNRKDLSIRLSQFFDHFLKGAPMPVWMSEGVPATEKGRTMGTELTKPK